MDTQQALIFDIYRGTSHDGPGQRDTVFFKGCPLNCAWCHNPEGISAKPLVWWQSRQCIGCLLCKESCKSGALEAREDGIHINRSLCISCGSCVKECPSQALSFSGETWTLEKLLKELIKDKAYYLQTGGGVTASGGEAMMQHSFVAALFEKLHENGISTALDTCGYTTWENYLPVLRHTDYVLYDLKHINSDEHKRFTGLGNELILDNARKLADYIRTAQKPPALWIRTPLIPESTATAENLAGIAAFIVKELGEDIVERWELCSFNNSCISKYERLDKAWPYANKKLLKREEVNKLYSAAVSEGFPADKLFVTGIVSEG